MLSRGDIVLVPFPFTDGTSSKLWPALVVALSQRHQDDELDILTSQPDFAISGLKVSSRLRLTRMTTLAMPLVLRRIDALPQSLQPDYQRRVQLMFG
jgi:mRNA interferase MazF